MAPLTWRNVDAPDLSTAANAMARATQGIQAAFRAGGDIGRGIYDDQVDIGSREAMRAAQQFGSSQELGAALQNGTAFGNMDPRFINSQTLQWGDERRRGLLGEEQTIQNMEIQRNAEARAAQAHALRMSGGGSGGGGGGGRSGSAAVRKADEFAVAQAEAARRLAVVEFGEDSPEALAATSRLAEISTETQNRSGLLDAADAYAGAITADRAEATAAGDAAVAAMSGEGGFNPYAIPLPSASPAAGIPGTTIPLTPPAAGASPVAALPVPNATAPGGPAPVAETAPAPAPAVSGLDWGLSMGTPVDAPAPAEVAPAASIERPNLSFGSEVPPMELSPAAEGRPLSWSQFAQEQLGDAPTAAAPAGSAVSMGLPAAVEELPQWGAYQADMAAFERSAAAKTALAEAERIRTTPNEPQVVKSAFDSSRAVIDQRVEADPIFAVYERQNDMSRILEEKGPVALADAVKTQIGMTSESDGWLGSTIQNQIEDLAKAEGVSLDVAAAAIVTAATPDAINYGSSWDMNNLWRGDIRYNSSKASDYIKQYKANESDPDGSAQNRNALGAVRMELNGIERGYAIRKEAEVNALGALQARPNDPRLQKAYADAQAATLAADKAAIAFREGLNDRLTSIGMSSKGVASTKPKVEDYITPQMREEATVLERERAAEAAFNIENFGVENPTFVGFQNGRFDPGNVSSDSNFGIEQANTVLPMAIMKDFAGVSEEGRKSFFEWVAASPNASREIFGRIQDMEYNGEDVDLPETVDKAYQDFTKSNVPEQAINDLTALGFDLSGDPQLAAAVMNDREVQQKLRIWRENEGFWTRESTSRFNRQNAQAVIRAALKRNQPDER